MPQLENGQSVQDTWPSAVEAKCLAAGNVLAGQTEDCMFGQKQA